MNKLLFQRLDKLKSSAPEAFALAFPELPIDEGAPDTVLLCAYNGKLFRGNAFLSDSPFTVEYEIFRALIACKCAAGVPRQLDRAGRTDSGVSALCNYVAFRGTGRAPPLGLLNSQLCGAIHLRAAYAVPNVDLRFSCASREYVYKMPQMSAYQAEASRAACRLLVGTHDFANLAHEAKSAVRTVLSCDVCELRGAGGRRWHALRVVGKAFCRNQIRCFAAAVQEGPERVRAYLESPVATRTYKTASPYYLCLVGCAYDKQGWRELYRTSERDFAAFVAQNDLEWALEASADSAKQDDL